MDKRDIRHGGSEDRRSGRHTRRASRACTAAYLILSEMSPLSPLWTGCSNFAQIARGIGVSSNPPGYPGDAP